MFHSKDEADQKIRTLISETEIAEAQLAFASNIAQNAWARLNDALRIAADQGFELERSELITHAEPVAAQDERAQLAVRAFAESYSDDKFPLNVNASRHSFGA